VIRTTPESDEDTETGVTFCELQLLQVRNIREAVAVAAAKNDDELDTVLLGLIISLLCQDTSQL
jgi:hypothetical protein